MKLTPEQIKQNAAAVEAHLNGDPIQCRYKGCPTIWTTLPQPSWEFENYFYRPKPEPKPKTRAWSNPDDVPGPICWLRVKEKPSGHYMPLSIWWDGIALHFKGEGYFLSWQKLAEKCEYSTDRKTWHKCEVVEP